MAAPSFLRIPPAGDRFNDGGLEVMVVSDGEIEFDSVASEFSSRPEADVNRLLEPDSSTRLTPVLPLNCLLLTRGGRKILFDTGMGASTALGNGAGAPAS